MQPFGERSWEDVRSHIHSTVRRRWRNMPVEDIEDAVSDAVTDLLDYWLHLDSSLNEDPERNFAYAHRRGVWVATTALVARFGDYEREVHLVEPSDEEETRVHPRRMSLASLRDEGLGPEDAYIQGELLEQVREAVKQLTLEDWDNWFEEWAEGVTEQESAGRAGVTQQAISGRRRRGLEKLIARV